MTMPPPILSDPLPGQAQPTAALAADLAAGRVAHAYLFSGSSAPILRETASAFAAALVCPRGGCGDCDHCRRVRAGLHPDVETVEPAGVHLLVDQVRETVRAAWRTPVASARRIVVVDRADRMTPGAQNAFLKALEEPPATTTILLLAVDPEALLETVRSRCRELVFPAPSEAEIGQRLREHGLDAEQAQRWARLAGQMDRARTLAEDANAREARRRLVGYVIDPPSDPGAALEAAGFLVAEAKAVRERAGEQHRTDAAEQQDWLAQTKKTVEDRIRREQRRAEQEAVEAALDDLTVGLRDLLVTAVDPQAPLLDPEVRAELQKAAGHLGERVLEAAISCLDATERCRRRLRANANVQLAVEQVFLALWQNLAPRGR